MLFSHILNMKFIIYIFIFNFLSFTIFGQISELSKELIIKNKIDKCIEYDCKDSINFYKNHQNGLYTNFDEQGRIIEKNFYSSYKLKELERIDEIKVIYLYDKQGRQLMWHWYNENSIPKITRTRIENYDSIGRNIGYCEYSPNCNLRCDNYTISNEIKDSSIFNSGQEKTKIYYTFLNKQRADTVKKYVEYYKGEQKDSCVLICNEKNRVPEKLTTKYFYESKKLIKSEFVRYYDNQITETNTIHYLKNGLFYKIDTISYYFPTKKSKPRIDLTSKKFIYSFWK
jgi:hypothetical protein